MRSTYILLGGLLLIFSLVTFVAIDEYKQGEIRYKGDTNLTEAQFQSLLALPRDKEGNIKDIGNIYEYYLYSDNGITKIKYDFYSSLELDYLTKIDKVDNFIKNPYYTRAIELLQKTFIKEDTPRNIGIAVLIVILVFLGVYWINKNILKVYKWINRSENYIYNRANNKLPDIKDCQIVKTCGDINTTDAKGIICTRSWTLDKHNNLKSLAMDTVWLDKELFADKTPCKEDRKGVYAYRIGTLISQRSDIMGIVEMDGKYEYHPDGVVRAEHCKILCLLIRHSRFRLGKILSNKYKVPVYFCETAVEGYLDWLYNANGIEAIKHNSEVIGDLKDGYRNSTEERRVYTVSAKTTT